MNTAERHDDVEEEISQSALRAAPDLVEVRRNGGLAALVGVVASGVAIAYLSRAATSGAVLDWLLFALMGAIGAAYLRSFVDARTPLLVADAQGLRVRLGRAWRGLPWGALESIEHTPRRGLLHDGRLVLHPHNTDRVVAELDGSGRRQVKVNERLYGAPFALPLGLSTRVTKGDEDLASSLRHLSDGATRVLEPVPDEPDDLDRSTDPGQSGAPSIGRSQVESDEDETRGGLLSLRRLRGLRPGEGVEADDSDAGPATDAVHTDDWDGNESDGQEAERDDTEQSRLDLRPAIASVISSLSGRMRRHKDESLEDEQWSDDDMQDDTEDEGEDDSGHEAPAPAARLKIDPVVASATPSPLREARPAARAEVRSSAATVGAAALARSNDEHEGVSELPEGRELRRQGSVPLVEETTVWGDRVRPIATARANVEPLVIDEYAVEPAVDPVIGPDITAGRTRVGLSVDALAERTRIRPHVIESIEVDDFVPCGGDFYARGHLRTLARVLGLNDVELLKTYDDRYADAPINPRRVFEAELATGSSGGIRSTKGGPNWSVLIAAIMTLVLAWSIARLVMDEPAAVQDPAPMLNGSGGPNQTGAAAPTTLKVTADGESHLKITNAKGKVVFDEDVEYGEVHRLDVSAPVTVKASDAGAISVDINGNSRGDLGADGHEAEKTFQGGN